MSLKTYIGYDKFEGARGGAVLIFAHSIKEAKKLAFPVLQEWFDMDWIDMRVNRIYGDWLQKEKLKNEPHTVKNPKVCEVCETWGTEPYDEHICKYCYEMLKDYKYNVCTECKYCTNKHCNLKDKNIDDVEDCENF